MARAVQIPSIIREQFNSNSTGPEAVGAGLAASAFTGWDTSCELQAGSRDSSSAADNKAENIRFT